MKEKDNLTIFIQKLSSQNPKTAALTIEGLSEEGATETLLVLPDNLVAKILSFLTPEFASKILENFPTERIAAILGNQEPHQSASIIRSLGKEAQKKIVDLLSPDQKEILREILTFPQESAGRLMTTTFTAFQTGTQINQAIEKIRNLAQKKAPMTYTYVLDSSNQLVGVLNMRDLMLAEPQTVVEDIMRREIIKVNGFTSTQELTKLFSDKKLMAVPVVDSQGHMLGVVRSAQLFQGVQEEATEGILRMFGVGRDETTFSPLFFSMKRRLPWLHINLVTAFMAASVVALFEGIIARITVLAIFLPVVAGQGGNAGAQSLAVVMRGLVMREIPKGKAKSLLIKEASLGLINGLVIGIVTGLIAWLWKDNYMLGVVIALAMVVNLTCAGFTGAAIPLALKALKLDPAQSSNILLTTVTDIVGFFAFLGFAVIFANFLI